MKELRAHRIKGFSDFVHRPDSKELEDEKFKLTKHSYEEGHKVGWDEARILDIESHSKYRKYK
jgi:hypothetical protein